MIRSAIHRISERWRCESGYRDVLVVGIPLILSTSMWSVQHFVDRMFLARYAPEAVAASMPAGLVNFTIMSFFVGTASYVGTFVAQYYGANRPERVGPALWQALYVAMLAGVVHLCLIPFVPAIFRIVGHEPLVQEYETIYMQVLCLGAGLGTANSAMCGFFAGRGKTWPVLWVNVAATVVNVVMNYVLIFGKWGFPELGVKGAAIGTVMAVCTSFLIYVALLSQRRFDRRYHTLRGWRFDPAMFRRLMRYGLPNGFQFFLDIAGFTVFLLLVGRLGTTSLTATVLAFSVNLLAFMPILGLGTAISIVVGQQLGKNRPDMAERGVYSGLHIAVLYVGTMATLYMFVPDVFLSPFSVKADPETFAEAHAMARVLVRFVAVFAVFDMMNIMFASALKGAGDTFYIMCMLLVVPLLVLVAPTYVALTVFDVGLYTVWVIVSLYIATLAMSFYGRFRVGKWKHMRVIERSDGAESVEG